MSIMMMAMTIPPKAGIAIGIIMPAPLLGWLGDHFLILCEFYKINRSTFYRFIRQNEFYVRYKDSEAFIPAE